MTLHRLHRAQRLPVSQETAWHFFSDPGKLRRITPPRLDFQMTEASGEAMHPGQIITYTIRPFLRRKVRWVTEIAHVEAPRFFVDEQRFGPYRFWHHQHHLRPVEGGVEAEDLVHYALPFGPLGTLAHRLVVRRRLEAIFDYRRRALEEHFGAWSPAEGEAVAGRSR